jgi:hypothetical protein
MIVDAVMKKGTQNGNGILYIYGNIKDVLDRMIISTRSGHTFMNPNRHGFEMGEIDIFAIQLRQTSLHLQNEFRNVSSRTLWKIIFTTL